MLRITPHDNGGAVCLKLEGQLNGPWVAELQQACTKALESECPLELDLADLSYADHAGARLLGELAGNGAILLNPSAFVREQIRRQSSARVSDRCASG